MPIYEYKCIECGTTFEFLLLHNETETDVYCSKCGEKNVKRIYQTGGIFIFKGTGFYETDYKKNDKKNDKKDDKEKKGNNK